MSWQHPWSKDLHDNRVGNLDVRSRQEKNTPVIIPVHDGIYRFIQWENKPNHLKRTQGQCFHDHLGVFLKLIRLPRDRRMGTKSKLIWTQSQVTKAFWWRNKSTRSHQKLDGKHDTWMILDLFFNVFQPQCFTGLVKGTVVGFCAVCIRHRNPCKMRSGQFERASSPSNHLL